MAREIEIRRQDNTVIVALDRPEYHNAMTPTMIAQLTDAFHDLADDQSVRLVILTGNGRSFCAGADLNAMRAAGDLSAEANVADGQAIFDLMMAVDTFPRPVIGRINGAAIGGGVGLVSCCDSVVAVSRATFSFSEARLGLVPAVISPFVLAKIGPGPARELFLSAERFPAGRAREIGLVHHVAQDEVELDEIVAQRAAQFLQAAPGAQAAAKQLIRTVTGQPKHAMRRYTAHLIADRRTGPEGKEGMAAFLQKRKPDWQQ